MKGRSHLSIGEVLSLLQTEFPDITISKIRFLESQGLLDPERTPSGYRKFYPPDLQQLRYILVQQRDHFLPLKVIKDRIAGGMHLPPEGERGAGDEAQGETSPAGAEVRVVGIGDGLGGTGRNGSDTGEPPDPLDSGEVPGAEDRPGAGAGGATPGDPAPTVRREATPTEAVGADRRVGVEAPEFGGSRSPGLAGAPVPAGATIGEGTAHRAGSVASPTGLPPSGTQPAAQSPALADPSSSPPDPLAGPAARVPTSSDADAPLANGLGAPGVDPAGWSSEPNAVRSGVATAGSGAPGGARSGAAGLSAGKPATTAHESGDPAGAPGRTGGHGEAIGGDPVDDDAPGAGGTGVGALTSPEASAGSARPAGSSGASGAARPADPAAAGRGPAGDDDPAALAAPAAGRAAGRQATADATADAPSGPAGAGRRRSSGPGGGGREVAASSGRRGGDLTSVSLSLTELAGAAGLEVNELRDLERYGVVVGRRVGADTVYGDEALQAAQVAARFRRHGIEARHLRAYRMAADREVGLFEQVVAPQLRARSLGPGNTPAETLDELEELGESLRHVLVRQALLGLIDGG